MLQKLEVAKKWCPMISGGVEGPPHVFFNIMLSHTDDDLITLPYDLTPAAI